MDFTPADGYDPESRFNLFQHDPLDLDSPSIRLIKILSPNIDGQIECRIRLASTDEDYICLSYVWGKDDSGQWISLNNRNFFVRRNLWNFLSHASAIDELRSRWIWIDAICIDQCDTLERQHQVQQMAEVYFTARLVVSWLGMNPQIAQFLATYADEEQYGFRAFVNSPYWTRAWITQEFVLARRVKLMAGRTLIPLEVLSTSRNCKSQNSSDSSGDPMWPEVLKPRAVYWRLHASTSRDQSRILRQNTLMQLLEIHGDKHCHLRRDSIFSLLGLCRDIATKMVDYDIPDTEVAMNVFKASPYSFCLCSFSLLQSILDLRSAWYLHLENVPTVFQPSTRGSIKLRITRGHEVGFKDVDSMWTRHQEVVSSADACGCAGGISIEGSGRTQWVIIIDISRICTIFHGTLVIIFDSRSVR